MNANQNTDPVDWSNEEEILKKFEEKKGGQSQTYYNYSDMTDSNWSRDYSRDQEESEWELRTQQYNIWKGMCELYREIPPDYRSFKILNFLIDYADSKVGELIADVPPVQQKEILQKYPYMALKNYPQDQLTQEIADLAFWSSKSQRMLDVIPEKFMCQEMLDEILKRDFDISFLMQQLPRHFITSEMVEEALLRIVHPTQFLEMVPADMITEVHIFKLMEKAGSFHAIYPGLKPEQLSKKVLKEGIKCEKEYCLTLKKKKISKRSGNYLFEVEDYLEKEVTEVANNLRVFSPDIVKKILKKLRFREQGKILKEKLR